VGWAVSRSGNIEVQVLLPFGFQALASGPLFSDKVGQSFFSGLLASSANICIVVLVV